MLPNNLLAMLVTFTLALLWLRLNNFAAKKGWVGSDLSRKIIHMGTGPIFVLCWLLFQDTPDARFLAALVPFAITAQFILVGTGIIKDESAVRSMSRTGDRREILRGPLYYGIVFVVVTLVFWDRSPAGMIALMLLCGGDGLADISDGATVTIKFFGTGRKAGLDLRECSLVAGFLPLGSWQYMSAPVFFPDRFCNICQPLP
jgi:phytol kinase